MKKKSFLANNLIILFAMFTILGCSKNNNDGNDPGGGTNTNRISMKNSVFSPSTLTVTMGGTVTWINDDSMVHTVTANDGSFNSGDIQPGATYSRTFNATGPNPYHCVHHSGMTGTITVVTK